MKIVYLLNKINGRGGLNRIVFDKINYLADFYSVSVIYFGKKEDTPFYNVDKRVKFYEIPIDPFVSSFKGKLSKVWFVYKRYKELIKKIRPDIIDNVNTNILSWLVPFINTSVPKVLELHQSYDGVKIFNDNAYGKNSIRGKFAMLLRQIVYPYYNKIIVLTNTDKRKWGYHNIKVISNYTNMENQVASNPEHKNFIWVGRLSHQKGLDLLFEIWDRFSLTNSDWRLTVIGNVASDKDTKTKEQMARFVNRHKNVNYIQETNKIDKFYRESSAYLSTSRYEGLPLCLIEAATMGLPIICFNITGNDEVVSNDFNGILVNPYDVDGFVNEMKKITYNHNRLIEYGSHSLEKSKEFNKNIIMRKWVELFNNLINDK